MFEVSLDSVVVVEAEDSSPLVEDNEAESVLVVLVVEEATVLLEEEPSSGALGTGLHSTLQAEGNDFDLEQDQNKKQHHY